MVHTASLDVDELFTILLSGRPLYCRLFRLSLLFLQILELPVVPVNKTRKQV